MKNILIIYSKMVIGGSTTSLLSFLNCVDYSKYSIDLQLYDNSGELQNQLNPNVHVLNEMKSQTKHIKKIILPSFWSDLFKARFKSKKCNNSLINSQYMAKYEAYSCPYSEKKYDIAISYLEFWPMEYLVSRVNALKKIGWIHIDIKEAGLLVGINNSTYRKLDKIVLVSKSCAENMKLLYPELSDKIICIHNILVKDTICHMAKQSNLYTFNDKNINFVTVCRLVCASKGLDRGIEVFSRLKKEGLLPNNVRWYIIGDGTDRNKLEQMIIENDLENIVILLGQHKNPYAIEKYMHYFLLPSRYEGKPMAITEAQMLGIVPVVCNYSSASEQIENGVDGIISENDDNSLYETLKNILNNKYDYEELKLHVSTKEYGNMEEIYKIYDLFEGLTKHD